MSIRQICVVLASSAVAAVSAADVAVSIDRSSVLATSQLELGVTHTHEGLDQSGVRAQAVTRGKAIIEQSAKWQNTHIIGWGPGDINPSPGVYDWGTLDNRINMMRTMDVNKVITLCTAPGWMKPGGDTWNMEERIKAGNYDEFADLALRVAKRYPDVKHFQVWNELKGFWNLADNRWDIEAYTAMYNQVYDKLKAYDPTIQVGGLYMVVSGTGSGVTRETGGIGKEFGAPLLNSDKSVIDYWLANKHGADFICIDRGIKDGQDDTPYTTQDLLKLTKWHGEIVKQVKQRTDLPVWYSEYYGSVASEEHPQVAAYASIYKGMVEAGTATALLWEPNDSTNPRPGLFTNVTSTSGGVLTPHGRVYSWISEYFGPGTELFSATTDSLLVEALASDQYTMLVNKSDVTQFITLGQKSLNLLPYEVRLLDENGAFMGSTQIVPEPSSLLFVSGGAMALLMRRRTRAAGEQGL